LQNGEKEKNKSKTFMNNFIFERTGYTSHAPPLGQEIYKDGMEMVEQDHSSSQHTSSKSSQNQENDKFSESKQENIPHLKNKSRTINYGPNQ